MSVFEINLENSVENIGIDITAGNLKVITSGVVASPNNLPIDFTIAGIKAVFKFMDDEENEKTRIKTLTTGEKEIEIQLYNFYGANGQGKVIPSSFIKTENFNIYFTFIVQTLNKKEKHRQLQYTFYYGEKK